MRAQLRLRFIGPLLVVAVAGLGVMQFGLLERVGLVADEGEPVAASAAGAPSPESDADGPETGAGAATTEAAPEGEAPAEETSAPSTKSGGMEALDAELEKHKVVVLVTYSPDSAVDTLVTSQARLGASDVGVGFVSVNAAKEKMIGELALEYDLRETPTVLVFRQGPELQTRLVGWADRETVAQAAQNARRA